jgi:hypothetical protein
MRKGTITNRTIARDMMNMLRPNSILNKNLNERQEKATKKAKEWRDENPEKSRKIGILGGNKCKEMKVGIHALTKEQLSEYAKKNYREGKGFAKLTKEERSIIGKKVGKQNLVGEIICEKCGRKTNKGNYRFHGDNCREFDKINLIDNLPNKFTKAIAKEIAEKLDIMNWEKLYIFHETCPYTECYIKVNNPNQHNPSWYKKNTKEINKIKKYINK